MKTLLFCLSASALALAASLAGAASSQNAANADMPLHSNSINAVRPGTALGPTASIAGNPTDADVGDSDSFGRKLQWLGLMDASVTLASDCTGAAPPYACQVVGTPDTITTFDFEDLNRVSLPKNSADTLLCYWFSPWLDVDYTNPSASTVLARVTVDPTLTIESPVLSTPGLIDPTTGAPFNGKLLTGMTSLQHIVKPLSPGLSYSERTRDSSVCIAGFLTKSALKETYGLSNSQANDFFNKPIVVHLNISGSTQYVGSAYLYFGMRIVGD
jgi:hypothetical protein